MRLVVLFVAFAVLTSSAFAQDSQQVFNLGPEIHNRSATSESRARMPQRAKAPQPEPHVFRLPCEAAVVVHLAGDAGTGGLFGVSNHIFSYLPIGSRIDKYIRKPNGEVYPPSVKGSLLTVPGPNWQGWIWYDPLPADWPEGITDFVVVSSYGEWKCTAVARVAIGGAYPTDGSQLGPLEEAIVDSAGGVILRGVFRTPPVVVAPTYLNQKVELVGDYYVPPGAIGTGQKPLAACSGRNGDPFFLECSTKTVLLP